MATIRETILKVKPGRIRSLPLQGIDPAGFRQEAVRLNREARLRGQIAPEGKPLYSISVNKKAGFLYIINNCNSYGTDTNN